MTINGILPKGEGSREAIDHHEVSIQGENICLQAGGYHPVGDRHINRAHRAQRHKETIGEARIECKIQVDQKIWSGRGNCLLTVSAGAKIYNASCSILQP